MFWNIRCYYVRITRGDGYVFHKCCPKIKFPLLILVLVLVLVLLLLLLLLVHQGNRPGTLSPCPQPDRFQYVLEPSRLEPCLENPPEPTRNILGTLPGTFRNPVAELCPGTLETCPEPAQNLLETLPRTCPGSFPEPVVRKPPRHRPGTYIG